MKKGTKYFIVICLLCTIFLGFKVINVNETKKSKSNSSKEVEIDTDKYIINDLTKANNSVMDNATKLKKTKSYLYFDERLSKETIQLNLKDLYNFQSIESVNCLWNGELKANEQIVEVITWENGVLTFNLTGYIDRFNQIKVCSSLGSLIIEVGDHYFQKLNKNTLEEKKQFHLVNYETENRFNSYHGTFAFDKTVSDKNLKIEIPDMLRKLNIIDSEIQFSDKQLDYYCNVSKETFEKLDLYSIEFDMVANQFNDGESYKLIECFIPLIVKE